AAGKREDKVNVEELLDFIFPKSLQHPLSTGRLYAFGMYGPLDSDANLRAGHQGQRVVSTWEIDTMCLQFEKEDILKVYLSGGRPLFALNDAQKQEVIAQADSHLKTAKGRGYRRQVTRAEVVQLLSDLARDLEGLVSFHDAQEVIVGYREKQIARFKVIFPQLVTGSAKNKQHRAVALPADSIGSEDVAACFAEQVIGPGGGYMNETVARRAKVCNTLTSAGRTLRGRPREDRAKQGGGKGRMAKFSTDVAPAEMFIKDVGLTPAGVASQTSKLLSMRAYKVGNIADGNDPGLTQNVKLIREDKLLEAGQRTWDSYACLRGYNIGGHVESARSSTTAKRKA
ncbi:unnamed protein product, partial [Scytosiphon promiscuus]